jgi:hypothetical protein
MRHEENEHIHRKSSINPYKTQEKNGKRRKVKNMKNKGNGKTKEEYKIDRKRTPITKRTKKEIQENEFTKKTNQNNWK